MKLANPYYEVLSSQLFSSQYRVPPFAVRAYFQEFRRWRNAVRTGPVAVHDGPERLTAILLSYKRVRNMEPIVESLLRTSFVERIVVSNNNPEYRIADWIRVRDPRIHLIDQPRRTPAGIRFELALQEPGPFYLSIDDDILLYPDQIRRIFRHLVANPVVPHGIHGEMYFPDDPAFDEKLGWATDIRSEQGVDSLNCVYAFHRNHLLEMQRLAGLIGLDVGAVANGEDVLISTCGKGRARVHEVGPILICLSSHRAGVATWRTRQNFFAERGALLQRLRAVKNRPSRAAS